MKTILFDLDGTLTNPQEGILNCIRYALDKMNVPHPPVEQLLKYIGPSLWESFKEMLSTDDNDTADMAVQLYRERFSKEGKFENQPYQGIHESLESIRSKGYKMFVCTSKPAVFARQIAEHFSLDSFFDDIYGSNLDGSLVDKTQLIAHIIASERLDPQHISMVGDRKYDIIGAQNNKVTPYGVLYGFGSKEELKEAVKLFAAPIEISENF